MTFESATMYSEPIDDDLAARTVRSRHSPADRQDRDQAIKKLFKSDRHELHVVPIVFDRDGDPMTQDLGRSSRRTCLTERFFDIFSRAATGW